nr:ribonuclease H-like domain-containing protein [Tanacetum cinerariifolium]
PQLDNDDLKQINADNLEEMDLKWQMAMLIMRARKFLQKTGRNLGVNGPTSMVFDMAKFRKSQFDVMSYQTGLESVEARLLVYKKNESVFEENIKLLNIEVPKDVPSLAQSPELVKTPRHSGLISPPPMLVAPPIPLKSHSSSKGLKRPKKTCFVCKSETHLIKDCDFHARKLAQTSCAPRDFHKHNAPMKHSRILLHQVSATTPKSKLVLSAAARTVGAARPTFSKTPPYISPYTVSKSKAPIRRPFIRHTTPTPRLSPLRVHTANPFAVSAARVKAARPSVVSAAHIHAVKPSAVTAVQHTHTKKVWRPKTLVLDH